MSGAARRGEVGRVSGGLGWAEGGREQGAGRPWGVVAGSRWWAESTTRPPVSRWHQGLGRWLEPGRGVEHPQSFGSDSMGERQGDLIEEKLEGLEREHPGA